MTPGIEKRIQKLITFDTIRKLKILEIFQYNCIGFVLITVLAYFSNKYFFQKTYRHLLDKHKTNKKKDTSYLGFIILCMIVMLESFLILIILFYIRIILLIIPSLSSKINKKFKPYTTFNSIVRIAIIFFFIQFLSGYRGKMDLILDYEFEKHY
jgi:hypothetical protein